MFFTRKPWRKIQLDPVIVTVGDVTLTVGGQNGSVSVKIDAPENMKITRGDQKTTIGRDDE